MRALTLALAAMTMFAAPALIAGPALADGIERPRTQAPAARPRPAPAPEAPPPPPPVVRESPPVTLAPPPPPPPAPSNELQLSDAFFMTPLAGGVGYTVGTGAVYGGSRVVITGGGATFSGAGRDLSSFQIRHDGGGGGCRRC